MQGDRDRGAQGGGRARCGYMVLNGLQRLASWHGCAVPRALPVEPLMLGPAGLPARDNRHNRPSCLLGAGPKHSTL